jgi:hypothetical protein
MNVTMDPHLFTQIGLDSGSLTMLGTIVHSFPNPGEYRGVVHEGAEVKATFSLSSDKNSAVAQVSIDLASLVSATGKSYSETSSCCKETLGDKAPHRFIVNPRGYALFHVSHGAGGYSVHVRRTDADEKDKGYDSRSLVQGDLFTAIFLRPGIYSITNTLTGATGEIVVNYPRRNEKRYRPPLPVRVACNQKSFEPNKLQVDPGQGVIFENRASARVVIKLEKADDGPKAKEPPVPFGRIANRLR